MKLSKVIGVDFEVTPSDFGKSFAGWDSEEQGDFIIALSDEAVNFNWCMQACYIADYLIEKQKHERARECLTAILEHIDLKLEERG